MIVLDTDAILRFLDGDEAVVAAVLALEREGEQLGTTIVNRAELARGDGARPRAHRDRLAGLLAALLTAPLDDEAVGRFGSLMAHLDKAGRAMPAMDGLIAAIALEHGGRILTLNKKHFARVPGLEIVEVG